MGTDSRAFNADGTPRINKNGSWHRDVLLEEVGVITGMIDADTTRAARAGPESGAQAIEADLIIGTGALLPNGDKLLNDDNLAWDTDLILVDLAPGWAGCDRRRSGRGSDYRPARP